MFQAARKAANAPQEKDGLVEFENGLKKKLREFALRNPSPTPRWKRGGSQPDLWSTKR